MTAIELSVTFSPSMGTEIHWRLFRSEISPPVFSFDKGPLLRIAKCGIVDPDEIHVLFIDEINRGNI